MSPRPISGSTPPAPTSGPPEPKLTLFPPAARPANACYKDSPNPTRTDDFTPAAPPRPNDGLIRAQTRSLLARALLPKPKRLLVVMWDPHRKGQGRTLTPAQVDKALFGGQASSLREYYKAQSGGRAAIDKVAVLGFYDADKPADHYWKHPATANDGFDDGHVEKWAEALTKADARVDFASFDDNRDGKLSPNELGILIVIPQKQPFGTNRGAEGPRHTPLVLDGVKIGQIAEVYLPSPTNDGVVRHEVGHLFFGFPDLYGNNKYPNNAAGPYSVMDVTYTDAQVDAPLRLKQGWVQAKGIKASGAYELDSVEKSREVLTYQRPGSKPPEYFVIEKRVPGTYDRDLRKPGIVVWRVVDDGNPQNIYRVKPGGKEAWPTNRKLAPFELTWADGKSSGVKLAYDPKRPGHVDVTVK